MAGKPNIRRNKFTSIAEKIGSPKGRGIIKKGDARLKIIQKNRSKLVDARDRLAQMAKKTDARSKILKLRQLRTTGSNSSASESVRPVGSSILLKTDRNGKISLSTNKIKNKVPADINTAIRKELGLVSNQRKMISPPKNQMIRQIQRSVPSFRNPLNNERYDIAQTYIPPPVIKRTIRNDIIREMPPLPAFSQPHPVEQNLYSWVRPLGRSHPEIRKPLAMDSVRQSVEVTARNNLVMEQSEDWSYADPNVRSFKMSSMYVDDDEVEDNQPRNKINTQRVKTGVHARLDTPPVSGQSQGIFAQAKTKVVVPVGHRIVVSNLQSTVTQDDIRELFEDIGELLVSRLVRPGTAEVIYKNLKDAQKAVDTYHNRQLDGQPMKCLLVNKRPVNNPTAPALRTTKNTTSVLRTAGAIKKPIANSKSAANKLVPDISTIHKVLFHKT